MEMVMIVVSGWAFAALREGFREEDGILRIKKAWRIYLDNEFACPCGYWLKDGKLKFGDGQYADPQEFNDISIKEWKFYYSLTV